jgi:hypothetical protein
VSSGKNLTHIMRFIYNLIVLFFVSLIFFQCGNRDLDPPFTDQQTFAHSLYDDEAACDSARKVTYFLNCYEIVTFYQDGRVDVLLGGGDIMFRSTYTRKNGRVKIEKATGIPQKLEFKIISDSVLRRVDDDSEWTIM